MSGWVAALLVLSTSCGARTGLDASSPPDARPWGRDSGAARLDGGPRLDGGAIAADVGPPPDALFCPPSVPLDPARAEVAIVLDRSGSMRRELGDSGELRISAVRRALGDALPTFDDRVAFGMMLYPHLPTPTRPCLVGTTLTVPIRLDASRAILSVIDSHPPGGGTPTAAALVVAHDALAAARRPGSAPAIILATDGGPNCDPAHAAEEWYGIAPEACMKRGYDLDACLDDERTLDAIAGAAADGIPTYVIGMDMHIDFQLDLLDRMAVAGGVPVDGDHRFFDVTAPEHLTTVFGTIGDRVARCTYTPRAAVEIDGGRVTIDGEEVVPDGTDGWIRTPAGIELRGAACDRAGAAGAVVAYHPACR